MTHYRFVNRLILHQVAMTEVLSLGFLADVNRRGSDRLGSAGKCVIDRNPKTKHKNLKNKRPKLKMVRSAAY